MSIEAGDFVSIVGQSGTGKTTIARLIIAEEKPSEGQIIIGGWDITHIKNADIPLLRRQIGVVFQDFKLLPKKTLGENVAFALEVAGEPRQVIKKIVPQVLKIVGLENKQQRFPNEVSGGEQQRVGIARAIVHKPDWLLADEPTGNLDPGLSGDIIELFEQFNQAGVGVLIATHELSLIAGMQHRVLWLKGGRLC